MRTICIYFSLLFAVSLSFRMNSAAQVLPNGGMEDWTPSGQPPPFDWEEPTGWKSNNSVVEFISASVVKSKNAYEGTYSCFIKTIPMFGGHVAGMLVNGDPEVLVMDYTVNILSGGTPVSYRPDYLTGYYKYEDPEVPEDSAFVIVILKKFNTAFNKIDTIGIGTKALPMVNTYTQFTVNVNYLFSDIPDSVIVAFMSTKPEISGTKGLLYIDNVSLSPASGTGNTIINDKIKIYQDISTGKIFIVNNSHEKILIVNFYNSMGQTVISKEFNDETGSIELALPSGIYYYRVISPSGYLIKGKVISRKL
jgi:hypothetical protein